MTNNYADYKQCDAHGVQMPLRTGKDGKKFYSHGTKYNGELVWCSGYGYKAKGLDMTRRYLPEDENGTLI